ncbi:eukaryotic translation initiation factor 4E-binding protein 3 isoform X1 [Balaenoptera acutorostrata]|uniref:Eukaryotic translation initiation factor 4E-binding protein 3 isoform X1 n=1 Tax=Balaenoptera acutorostrata TaxID=9767 RepID=A0ABM3T157_BALAC|nr:eukaryotic translation initiation factor 4E-binding protein 3 isoform X1 [Balaenoptera acutorostrata]
MSTSTSCPIPGGRDWLPDCYSTTLGGTLYATTPGGQRPGQRAPGSSTTESSCWSARTHPLPRRPPAASLRFPGSQLLQQPHPPGSRSGRSRRRQRKRYLMTHSLKWTSNPVKMTLCVE